MRGLLLGWVAAAAAAPVQVVDLRPESVATRISVQACVGLFNRNESQAGAAYTIYEDRDLLWFQELEGPVPEVTPVATFLQNCVSKVAQGRVRYNYTAQRLLLPHLLTPAAVLGAIPFQDGDADTLPVVFDAVKEFDGMDEHDATNYIYKHYVNDTITMAKLNPGLDTKKHPPPLDGVLETKLIDYIVKNKLFTFWMMNSCIPLTKEHALMEQIANNNPWPKPIAVYGYDNSWNLGGDFFEAETKCTKEHQMGQVASASVANLGFLSRKPAITEPLVGNPAPTETYNASRSYVSFVIGDGDNVAILKGSHYDWVKTRLAECANSTCTYPLLWSVSPHASHLAPDLLQWFHKAALKTGQDHFVLPPSGHLYAYASEMQDDAQDAFVRDTEEDCIILNTSASVAWEWFGSWKKALDHYFPKYSKRNVVKSLFTTNVPYLFPVLELMPEKYKIVGGSTVVFSPREWRGAHANSTDKFFYTPEQMADELNNKNAPGTVSHIYLTSDGGGSPELFNQLVPLLDEHVKVVNHNALASLALQRG